MTTRPTPFTRRALLLSGAVGMALAGCSAASSSNPAPPARPAATRTAPPPPSPLQPSPSVPALPDVNPYVILPGEVEPAAKEAAVRFVEGALTRQPRPSRTEGARSSAPTASDPPGAAAAVLADALPLGGASAVRVVYPQYGGLTLERDLASVMVVAEQLTTEGPGQGIVARPFTVDVRLTGSSGAWVVTEALLGAPAPPAPSLSPAARAVLGDARIVLPGAARADVLSGTVDNLVLDALTRLAQRWTVDVHVFTSGHPLHVFATDRVSNHSRGLAVDVWALDGVPVVDRTRSPWREVLLTAADIGASELGGPEDLGERPFFSDQVHQDHLHLGFGAAAKALRGTGGSAPA